MKQTQEFVPSGPSTSWAQNRINVFGGPIFKRLMIRRILNSIRCQPAIDTFLERRLWRKILAHAATIASGVGLASETKMQEGKDRR